MGVHWNNQKKRSGNMSLFAAAARDKRIRELKAHESREARVELLRRKVVVIDIPDPADEQAYREFTHRLNAFKTACKLGGQKFEFVEEAPSAKHPRGCWMFSVKRQQTAA